MAWGAIQHASLPLLLAAIIANVSSLVFRAIRWWLLLRDVGAPSFWLAMRATLAGAGLNNVLVANGGEAARVVFVARATGIPSAKVLATVALDRMFDPIGFIGLLLFGFAAFDLPAELAYLRWPAIVAAVAIIVLLVWLSVRPVEEVARTIPHGTSASDGWLAKIGAWIVELGTSMHQLARGPRIIWFVILTFLAWLGQLATFVFAASAAHSKLPLQGSLIALLAVNISLIVRATPGNVGFFQFAYALATSEFGVSAERAVAISILIQTLQIIPITLLGVALAPRFIFKRRVRQS
jgi:uncharacterized protein (TIRG00374 family)